MPALFAGTMFYRYLSHFRYCPLGPQVKNYIKWQGDFLSFLPIKIRNTFIIRLSPNDYGWENKKQLLSIIPQLKFDDHKLTFQQQVKNCKLIVIDNCQTTFLEALLLNHPTILFYDPHMWGILNTFKPFVDDLFNKEILHYDPENAAKKVLEIIKNPGEWWFSKLIQKTRQNVLSSLIDNRKSWLKIWKKELLSEISHI